MIKPNELRIGSLLRVADKIIVVDQNIIGDCAVHNKGFNTWYDPIPITEKALLACGFCAHWADEFVSIYDMGNFRVCIYSTGSISASTDVPLANLSSLHQLQNLYFALTGEELKINVEEL